MERNLDNKGRGRNHTVAFRVSDEESELLNRYVRLSGLTKQSYITSRLLDKDIVVQGNPRVFKALRNRLNEVLEELRRIERYSDSDEELLLTIQMIARIMDGLKEESE